MLTFHTLNTLLLVRECSLNAHVCISQHYRADVLDGKKSGDFGNGIQWNCVSDAAGMMLYAA